MDGEMLTVFMFVLLCLAGVGGFVYYVNDQKASSGMLEKKKGKKSKQNWQING